MTKILVAWAWIKKNWSWKTFALVVAFPLGLLVVLTKLFKPTVTVTSSELSGHADLEKKLDEKREVAEKKLEKAHAEEVLDIQVDFEKGLVNTQTQLNEQTKAVQNDPIQLNDYLKRVGKNVRSKKS